MLKLGSVDVRLTLANKLHPFHCKHVLQALCANLEFVYQRPVGTTIQISALTKNVGVSLCELDQYQFEW